MDQFLDTPIDWEIDVTIGILSAFSAVLALRFMSWVLPSKSWFTTSGRRVGLMKDSPEVLGQKMADSIVDWIEDLVYRKVLKPDSALFMYALLANVLGDKDYLPRGEVLLRDRLAKITNPPVSTTEAVSNALNNHSVKRG